MINLLSAHRSASTGTGGPYRHPKPRNPHVIGHNLLTDLCHVVRDAQTPESGDLLVRIKATEKDALIRLWGTLSDQVMGHNLLSKLWHVVRDAQSWIKLSFSGR